MTEIEISQSVRETMDGFPDVWQRVTGKASVFSEDDTLKSFIRDELCAAAFDTSLARMFQSSGRAVLLAHAAAARRRARRLRAEYFIRTGVSYTPTDSCQPVTGKLASLRTAYERDLAAARAYTQAAGQTECPELREAYSCFADETQAAAEQSRALIIECF